MRLLRWMERKLVAGLKQLLQDRRERRWQAYTWVSWAPPVGWFGQGLAAPTEMELQLMPSWAEAHEPPRMQPYLTVENELGRFDLPFNGTRVEAVEVMEMAWALVRERRLTLARQNRWRTFRAFDV